MGKAEDLLPTYDQVHFEAPALELTIVQVKFPPLPRFSEENYLTDIKAALAEEYPLISSEQPISFVISIQGVSQSVNQAAGLSFWRFTSIDGRWSVLLTNESISLETREYTNFSEFSDHFVRILHCLSNYLHIQHQLRFGLRYINEFRLPAGETYEGWQRLLNSDLLGLGSRGILGGTIEQTIGEVRTHREDGILLVRHGFLKGTTVMPTPTHPAKTGPFYLLDLDYYNETPTKFEVESSAKRMARYNDILYRIFRWAIKEDELYHYLRGQA
jgi:uncharacterized protein (TIGR04255 family)